MPNRTGRQPEPDTTSSCLPADVTALLAAIRDALNVPLSHWDDASERAHHRILTDRASVARIILSGILDSGHDVGTSIDYLNERVTQTPVTYRLYVPEQATGGEPQ